MTQSKKVLVAGATGYLGRFVIQEFKNRGYWVRVLARNSGKLESPGPFLEPAVKHLVDDVFQGEVTKPETLQGVCDGIDLVFSSIGITRQRDGVSFMDVDYQGNKNLIEKAHQAGIQTFVFVSVFKANQIAELAKARELIVNELNKSSLASAIIRPTGYFSDMSEYLKMAQSGRVYMLGNGQARINPIHGSDLAQACVEAAEESRSRLEVDIGGPETFSHDEIAKLAFRILNKQPKIVHIPLWIMKVILGTVRPFNKHTYEMLRFFSIVMTNDFIAPHAGTHVLSDYFRKLSHKKHG